jgi:hypothetical protein
MAEQLVGSDELTSRWPPLPENCPLTGAAPTTGTFYRLSNPGGADDWALPVQLYDPEIVASWDPDRQCRSHGYSIWATFDSADGLRKTVRKFRNHKIVRVSVTPEWGVALRNNPLSEHHCLWPSESLAVPPDVEDAE